MKDLVSIITPVYNGEKHIDECIQSVLKQTYTNWELIIVDDQSTDETVEKIRNYSKVDERIHLYRNRSNQGVAKTRNIALSKTNGRFIAFLDGDDVWGNDKLKVQIEFMKRNIDASFLYSKCDVIDENSQKNGVSRSVPYEVHYKDLLKGNAIPCLTVLIDTKRISKELLYMPQIPHEDYATWLKILKTGCTAYGVQHSLASYREHTGTVSANKLKSAVWTWKIYRREEKLPILVCISSMFWYTYNAIKKRI